MRKIVCLLSALLLLILAAGCGASRGTSSAQGSSSGASASGSASANEELRLKTLNVELPRTADNTAELAAALQEFPAALKTALAQSGVEVDSVHVTVGTSTSATCAALSAGGVDVAFLPTADFTRYGEELAGILGDGVDHPGGQVQICAASTAKGNLLATDAKSEKALTWDELNGANWGVVKDQAASAGGTAVMDSGAVSLWLADNYQGNTLSDLSHVTVCDSYDELTRAVGSGKIDVFALPKDNLPETADALSKSSVMWTSEALFSWVAAVTLGNADLQSEPFAAALRDAVTSLCAGDPDRAKAFGAAHFQTVNDSELDATRRLWTLNG